MNNKLIISVLVAVIVVVGIFFIVTKSGKVQYQNPNNTPQATNQSGSSPVEAKNTVTIQNMSFSPALITVKVGDKITWTNQDSVGHSATADDNSFDTGILSQGQSGSVTFDKAGTYTYHCKVHSSMTGTIIVQ